MASKKDFSKVNTNRTYSAIAEATAEPEQQDTQQAQDTQDEQRKPRREYTEQEKQQFMNEGKTRGRKDVKMPRINMAFKPEIHEFIRVMAQARGETVTQFTNHVFARYMEENRDMYERAKEMTKAFKESLD